VSVYNGRFIREPRGGGAVYFVAKFVPKIFLHNGKGKKSKMSLVSYLLWLEIVESSILTSLDY